MAKYTVPKDDMQRTLNAARQVERMMRNEEGPRGRWFSRGTLIRFAKLDASLSVGSSCTASIWSGTTLADSGENVTVHDWLLTTGESLDSGTKVVIAFYCSKWYVIQASCPT